MPFKINIGHKGKSWKVESSSESFIGMKLGDKVDGKDIHADLGDYEFEISGASDKAGFPSKKDVDGQALRGVLLKKGWGMHTSRPKGLRLKKTVRGNVINSDVVQINLIVVKAGSKKFEEVFPEQNQPKAKPATPQATPEAAPAAK
jgi:small subunit ribosomal protein S6e